MNNQNNNNYNNPKSKKNQNHNKYLNYLLINLYKKLKVILQLNLIVKQFWLKNKLN